MNNSITAEPFFPDALPALRRAAARAQVIAIQTGTPLVIWRNGRVEKVPPNELPLAETLGFGPTTPVTYDDHR